MDYSRQTALVLGLGESGLAMARWLARRGAVVRVADTRSEPERLSELKQALPEAVFIGGEFTASLLDGVDFIALSPGLMPESELAALIPQARQRQIPLWSEIELFAQALAAMKAEQGYDPKVLAITGTNGKTTVTSLAGKMCADAGKTVRVAGNISPAVLDVMRDCIDRGDLPEIWVLELSSFQLWSTHSLAANAAVMLNLSQDHLDWHGDMTAYAEAKKRVFGQSTIRILNRDDPWFSHFESGHPSIQTYGLSEPVDPGDFGLRSVRGMEWLCTVKVREGERVAGQKNKTLPLETYMQDLMPLEALRIRGRHNASNALAALALCRAISLPMASLLHALKDYRGEPHRVEFIRQVAGVSYIDDSKGTNVGATVAAVEGLGGENGESAKRLLLIAGGDGKSQDFAPLVKPVSRHVHTVLLIGKDAELIRDALASTGADLIRCETLEQAVQLAAQNARAGDTVLLSPACASMDMFRNYAHRAEVFVSAVSDVALARGEVAA